MDSLVNLFPRRPAYIRLRGSLQSSGEWEMATKPMNKSYESNICKKETHLKLVPGLGVLDELQGRLVILHRKRVICKGKRCRENVDL